MAMRDAHNFRARGVRERRKSRGRTFAVRVEIEALEERRLLTGQITLSGVGQISAFAGVGFALNPVADIFGTNNGQVDDSPGDYTVEVEWGDGSESSSNAELALDGDTLLVKDSHIYQTEGTYDITVNATGLGTSASAMTTQVTVTPMPDAASIPPDVPTSYNGAQALGVVSMSVSGGGQISAFAGVGFALNPVADVFATYDGQTDTTLTDYHAQINWGDSPSWDTNVGLALDGSSVMIKGSHNYQTRGTYDVTVYITGPDGQTASATTTQVTVTPMPDAASIPPDVPTSYNGAQALGVVSMSVSGGGQISAFAGVGFALNPVANVFATYNGQIDTTLTDYHAQINWGDSPSWDTSATFTQDGDSLTVDGSHTYTSAGTYDVTVYITGPDGQTASATTTEVDVSANPVSVSLNAPGVNNDNAGSEVPYGFSLVFQDSGGMISGSSVSGTTVKVVPAQGAAITATLVSQQPSGNTDAEGDGSTITANYQITPPSGDWTGAPQGTYTVDLSGSPVTGLSGGEAPPGTVGTFGVNLAVKLVLEVAQAGTSVPEDATVPIEVQAVGPSGSPVPGASGTVTLKLNGHIVDNVNLQNGTGSATITAPGQPGQYQLQGDLSNLSTGNTGINVGNEPPSTSELLSSAANAAGQLGDLLKGLLDEDLKDPSQVAQAALKELEGLKNVLGKVVPALNVVPLAIDLGSLWNDATQPASAQNQAQFQKDFSNALKEAIGLNVAWGVTVGLELNPIGAVGGFLLNSAVQQGVNSLYDNYLQAGAMTTAGQLYQALKGSGNSSLVNGGVQYASGSGDPPPSIILVNPPNASSGADSLAIAGQAVYAQAGTSFNGVVATFFDASGNTNLSAYHAYIAWGDGNFTKGTVSALPGGGFEVSGSDTYTTTGIYSVSVIVTSTDGSSAVAYDSATVYTAGPTVATSAPVVSLLAPDVNAENADWLTPYTFSVVYQDSAMVSYASLSGSTVEVKPPTGASISASEIGTQVLGSTDEDGDGTTLIVTYEITPPGGNWYAAPPATYTVELGGSAVTDLSGHAVTLGSAGTFQESVPPTLDVGPMTGTDPNTGASVSNSAGLTLTGYAEAGSTVTIDDGSTEVGITQASADGAWSYSYQAPENGSYDFTATFSDSAGNTSAASIDFLIEVDTATPASMVSALPATTTSASFTVSWSGGESSDEPGVACYNVYVSDDGSPFALFQSDTVATSATFTGQPGQTYAFYSVATDYAGNMQPTPTAAQATTVANSPTPTPTPSPAPTPPPLVTVRSSQAETIKIGTGKKAKKETVIVVDFSGALNAASANNAGAYELAPLIKVKASGKGKNKKPATTKLGALAAVASAAYMASNDSVTLIPRAKLTTSKPEELVVNGTLILDTLGRGIDGAANGQPGSDYIATMSGTRVTAGGLPLARTQSRPASVEDTIDAVLARSGLAQMTRSLHARRDGPDVCAGRQIHSVERG